VLSDGQRRHVGVFLAQLEEALDEIEAAARPPEAPSRNVLTREQADVPAGYGEAVAADLLAVREGIRRLARAFHLTPTDRSRARRVRALLGAMMSLLPETRSDSLRAFGDLDPSVADALDPALDALRARLTDMLDELSRRSAAREGT
jgi:hypothetical protein